MQLAVAFKHSAMASLPVFTLAAPSLVTKPVTGDIVQDLEQVVLAVAVCNAVSRLHDAHQPDCESSSKEWRKKCFLSEGLKCVVCCTCSDIL